MANRVTSTEVKQILVTVLTGSQLDPFITAANLIVTEKLGTSGLGDALLKEVERWLSAHFIYVSNPSYSSTAKNARGVVISEKVGDATIEYADISKGVYPNLGLLSGTVYGQQAIIIDLTGTLANLGKKRASVNVFDVINTDDA